MKETYYRKVQLPSEQVHVYAGPTLFASLDYKVLAAGIIFEEARLYADLA
ncbi:hypothetical protein L1N85_12600 [Paenibacillus alkaliterrae]|nr:hypothetical protein [Paenibacillus alkaliterrae]MCF2939272.1 hypothetical protein [Paenibacillus alkaliterrae]